MELFETYVLENPYPLLAVMGFVWVVLFVIDGQTGGRVGRRALAAIPLSAAAVLVASYWIETDREAVVRTMDRLAAAAETHEPEAVMSFFELEGGSRGLSAPLSSAVHAHVAYVQSCSARDVEASSVDGDRDRFRVRVRFRVMHRDWGPHVIETNMTLRRLPPPAKAGSWVVIEISEVAEILPGQGNRRTIWPLKMPRLGR
jgi:hypothetical protein